jgi:hypothetical protein
MIFTLTSCDVKSIIDSFILDEGLLDLDLLLPSIDMDGGSDQVGSKPSIETSNRIELDDGEETEQDTETEHITESAAPDNDKTPEESNSDESELPTIDDLDNGVLQGVCPDNMDVPENIKLLGTDLPATESNSSNISALTIVYILDGSIINWKTEDDLIYVITSGNNRLVVIDSKTMCPVYNVPLAGQPAEINLTSDKIYISLPDLCRIDVFSKIGCQKESSLYFDHAVSSFCLDGSYIYYSEHDQHCKVFKKDLITGETVRLTDGDNYILFYYPKLYLNKEDGILYVGECKTTGSTLYYYDTETLEMIGKFKKDNYGIMNHTREIFKVGDDIFWGSFRLSATDPKELIGKYGSKDYGSTVYASEELVSTYDGLFLTDTYECIVNYSDADFRYEYLIVTESNNFFFRQRSINQEILVGVNFNMQ